MKISFKGIPSCDEEYTSLLEAIVKGAEFLENPLIKSEQYQKGIEKYERYCEWAIAYRTSAKNQPNDGQRAKSA